MLRADVRRMVGGGIAATLVIAPSLVVPLAGAETGPLPEVTERRVLTNEHVDALNIGYDGDRLTVNSKISPPAEFIDVDDLIYQVSDLGYVEGLPEQYVDFIGTSDIWLIPQTQSPDVVWAGWNTEDIDPGVLDDDTVDITLTDVQGPGELEVWQTVGFGDIHRIFSSDEDFTTLTQSVNAHVHANWAFTEPGVYTVTFATAATVEGRRVTSDPVEYTWVVGGNAGSLPAAAASVTVLDVPPTASADQEVDLTAHVSTDVGNHAPPAPCGYVEFHDGDASLGRIGIEDGRATLPVTFTEAGTHEITAIYTSQEPQFYSGSTSEPRPIVVDDSEEPPPATTVTISGPGAVAPGDEVTLTAVQDPDSGASAYQWMAAPPGSPTFAPIDGAGSDTLTFTAQAASDGTRYRAHLVTDDGHEVAVSEPYTLVVEDDPDLPVETTLTIEGVADGYEDGDPVELTVTQNPPTGLDDYHWFAWPADAAEPAEVGTGPSYATQATPDLDGTRYSVELRDEDGWVVATSAPVTVVMNDDPPPVDDPDQCLDPRTVLTNEHADLLAPALDGSALTLRAKVGTASDHTFYDPADLLVQVRDPEAATTIPAGEAYGFLGEAGEPLWLVPQTQNPDIVWAGWSTEELAPGTLAGDAVDMTLVGVEGPGEVEVFQTDGLGAPPTRIFSSEDALEPRHQVVGQHVHANWAFTELGEYTLTFEMTAALADGTPVTSGEVDYAFVVGDLACPPEDPPGGDETGGDETGGDETGGDETGGDETGGDQTGGDETGAENGGGDTSGSESPGGDASGGDVSGGDVSGGDDVGTGPRPTTKPTTKACVPAPSTTPTRGTTGTGGGDRSGDQVVLTNEHVDLLSPYLDGSALSLRSKVGSANDHTFHDPADVLVHLKSEAASTVPVGETYAFLGTAGDPLWLIPETQDPAIVWAGWSTEELPAGSFTGDAVDMRLVGVEGPGAVEVFQSSGFGDVNRIFSSEESLQPRRQSLGQHVHANWAFSAEGSYTLTFEVSGTLAGGGQVTTGPVAYSFLVGDAPTTQNLRADAATTRPTPTPTTTATPTPTTTAAPSTTAAAQGDDCDLASTGATGVSGMAIMAGILALAGGGVAAAAHRRARRTAQG